MRKVLVAVAPVAHSVPEGAKNPLSPQEVAAEVVACSRAGAGMVHLHVRDEQGRQTEDLTVFRHTLDRIRNDSGIVIQGSTGGVSDLSLEERCVSLNDPRVEVGSLNMGSTNFDEGVYINTLPDVRFWAHRMKETGVHPELEIFEGGMINNVLMLAEEGVLTPPFVFAFALGFRGALPARVDHLFFLKNALPPGSIWGFIHHGMRDLSLLAAAVGMGASFIRVGFEDSPYFAPNQTAPSNVVLVEKAVALVRGMGLEVASADEARKMMALPSLP